MSAPTLSPAAQKAIATTEANAATLWDDGYALEVTETPLVYFVRRPEPEVNRKTGEVVEGYHFDLSDGSCTCRLYGVFGVCKHQLAALQKLREALALVVPLLEDRPLRGGAARSLEVAS